MSSSAAGYPCFLTAPRHNCSGKIVHAVLCAHSVTCIGGIHVHCKRVMDQLLVMYGDVKSFLDDKSDIGQATHTKLLAILNDFNDNGGWEVSSLVLWWRENCPSSSCQVSHPPHWYVNEMDTSTQCSNSSTIMYILHCALPVIVKSYGTDVDDVSLATTGSSIINLQRTCAPRVTVPCLSVCLTVCQRLFSN